MRNQEFKYILWIFFKIELKLDQIGFLTNLKDIFPLFQKNCKIKFDKLNTFCLSQFSEGEYPFEIFENLFNNLDKIPNLKNFEINCCSDDIDNEIYEKFKRNQIQ